MTRGEFMSSMLEYVFGVKYIEFKGVKNSLLEYTKGGSFCKDCTYTFVYQKRLKEIFQNLLDEKFTEICIRKNKHSKPVPINTYREKAKNFIFDLKGYEISNTELFEKVNKNITLVMISRIYCDIIIEEIFNTDGKKNSKERSSDDFDDSVKNICHSVIKFIHSERSELAKRKYKKSFFKFLVSEYPVFSELNLDENNEIVQDHLVTKEKELKNIYSIFIKDHDDPLLEIDFVLEMENDNGILATFGDRNSMQKDDFEDLQMKLQTLNSNSQSYKSFFLKDSIILFKNTAVRIYNLLYGKNHPEYKGVISVSAWNAHEYFVEYLFNLDFVLKLYE